jgi:hypothetical protein
MPYQDADHDFFKMFGRQMPDTHDVSKMEPIFAMVDGFGKEFRRKIADLSCARAIMPWRNPGVKPGKTGEVS